MPNEVLLALRNGDEQLSINLTVSTDATPFVGYHLVSYQGKPPTVETARSSSLYVDGSTIVNYKAMNVVETIVLDIVGSTTEDAFDKLRALQRFVWSARDYHTAPASRLPSLMWYQPFNVGPNSYAVVFNAQVDETTASGRAFVDGNRIRNITVTVERESYWRQLEPNASSFSQAYNFVSGGTTAAYEAPRWWGALAFNGLAGGLSIPGGDVPALVRMGVTPNNLFKLQRAVISYVSQKRIGTPAGYTIPTAPILVEAEGSTIFDPSHTAAVFVNNASPYVGTTINTALRVTNHASFILRAVTGVATRTYNMRVFARMRVVSGTATTVSVQLGNDEIGKFGPAVVVSNSVTEWAMYDMGILPPIQAVQSSWSNTPHTGAYSIGLYSQHLTGSTDLQVDCYIFMPCDEYYLDMNCTETTVQTTPAMLLNNIMVPKTTVGNVSGNLLIPPGGGTLYFLAGWSNFQNSWDPISTPTSPVELNLTYNERYGSARGT